MTTSLRRSRKRLVDLLKRARGDALLRDQMRRIEERLDHLSDGIRKSTGETPPPPGKTGTLDQAPAEIQRLFVDPVPWMASGAVKRISGLLSDDMTVLEWGGGASTPYWCARVGVLHTVEASTGWAAILLDYMGRRLDLLDKWRLHFVPANWSSVNSGHRRTGRKLPAPDVKKRMEADYALLLPEKVDAIIVDGAVRQRTMERLEDYLRRGGVRVVVVDNTSSRYVRDSVDNMDFSGFVREDFWDEEVQDTEGSERVCTSVWYRERT